MAHRLFEAKHHASIYQKYRIVPPDSVLTLVLQYLNKRKEAPHELAVDLGCGTGQNTRLLAPHFQKVVGVDVSECQVEEARAVPGFSNVTYRSGPAEELPFPDGSVDLLTAACAAHWFDADRFLMEAERVLKPHGCIALFGYTDEFNLHYGSCGDKLNNIYAEVYTGEPVGGAPEKNHGTRVSDIIWIIKNAPGQIDPGTQSVFLTNEHNRRVKGKLKDSMLVRKVIRTYASPRVLEGNRLQGLFESIPFTDKERVERIPLKMAMTVAGAVGFVESFSYCQTYFKTDPQAAAALLESMLTRLLEEMGVSSPDTKLEFTIDFYCVLACKRA